MSRASLAFLLVLAVAGSAYAEEPEKIRGGRKALPGEYPHQVSLRSNGIHFCGGTIISDRHILTAAHCVDGTKLSTFTAVTGSNNLFTGGETHAILSAVMHESYIPQRAASWVHDIAILTLKKPIEFNNLQKPIALAKSRPPPGVTAVVSGFGYTEDKGRLSPDLKSTPLTILSTTTCQLYYQIQTIYSSHLCAMLKIGHGVCSGDSGGPLIYNNEVVGVVSWSIPCGLGMPDIFTSVPDFYNWITDHMK